MDRIMDTDLYANLVFKLEQRVKEEWFILCGLIITSTCSCKQFRKPNMLHVSYLQCNQGNRK